MKRQPERPQRVSDNQVREDNSEATPVASESGYDTTGDCQTPATPLDSPVKGSSESLLSKLVGGATTVAATEKPAAATEGRLGLHAPVIVKL